MRSDIVLGGIHGHLLQDAAGMAITNSLGTQLDHALGLPVLEVQYVFISRQVVLCKPAMQNHQIDDEAHSQCLREC